MASAVPVTVLPLMVDWVIVVGDGLGVVSTQSPPPASEVVLPVMATWEMSVVPSLR